MVLEGDFVPGVVASSNPLKPITGFNVFDFPSINGSKPAVMGGGDIVTMLKDTPASRALITYLATPAGGDDLGEARRLLVAEPEREGGRLHRRAPAEDRARAREGVASSASTCPTSSRRRSARRPGRACGSCSRTSSRNPNDVNGIAAKLEAAAAKAYK